MLKDRKIAALCTSRIFDTVNYLFIKQLGDSLRRIGIDLMVFCLNRDLYWDEETYYPEAEVFELVPMKYIDVLIIMDEKIKSRTISEKLIGRAASRNIPTIVVDGSYSGVSTVRFDFKRGFETVVRHVIEHHKVKKPHFLAGIRNNPFSEERIEVFKKVLADNGMEFKPSMLSYGEFWAEPARKAVQKLLDSGDIPDAVICANDIMAINASDVIQSAGLRVPEDIIVSGFDGYDEADFCTPKITTANCGSDLLVGAVCERISDCLSGKPNEDVLVMPEFKAKGSCGCSDDTIVSFEALTRFNNSFYRFQDDIRDLYEITAAMQMSDNPYDASSKLAQPITHDIHCFAYAACFDTERNFFHNPRLKSEQYKYVLFYSAYNIGSVMQELDDDLVKECMLEVLKNNMPIIFNELDHLGKPIGFICYTFKNYDIIDYAKTASITNTVSMGLGGYINASYQKFLADKVARTYRRDQLTGLYNRAGFENALARLLNNSDYADRRITVIMADLDGLKYINDTYGHEAGDTAIAEAAAVLKECCPDNALCVRFGGDEMLAVIPGECDHWSIMKTIDERLSAITHDYTVSMSCGAYVTLLNGEFDISDAIRQADEKMYHNKRIRKRSRADGE